MDNKQIETLIFQNENLKRKLEIIENENETNKALINDMQERIRQQSDIIGGLNSRLMVQADQMKNYTEEVEEPKAPGLDWDDFIKQL